MTDPPFHHGNLRAVLLDQAERTLRDQSIDELSLRQLARRAGVSHGAPRSHFIDRQALLTALAERGFARLADEVRAAIAAEADDFEQALLAAGSAYVKFAVTDAALLELMFAAKNADPPEALRTAAQPLFTAFGELIDRGLRDGKLQADDPYRLQLLFAATMQGIAALVAARRITGPQGETLIDDAVRLFTASCPPEQ